MKVKELKKILSKVPDGADILLAVNGHDHFTDSYTHGKSIIAHVTMDKEDVLVFSATSCGFDPMQLNYSNIKMVKKFDR